MRLVLATSNPAKAERLARMLADLAGLELVRPGRLQVAEGCQSLQENALIKARAYAIAYSACSVSTDGGLYVPALGATWNPALTGRRGGELLGLMRGLEGDARVAFQHESIVVVDGRGIELGSFEATSLPRYVAEAVDPRWQPDGFWLPGLLLYGPNKRRYADLSLAEKALAEENWAAMRDPVRALIAAELTRASEPARQHPA